MISPTLQPATAKAKKRRRWITIGIVGLIIIGVGLWLFWINRAAAPGQPQLAACPVNTTDRLTLQPPAAQSSIGREVAYGIRADGSYLPRLENITKELDGHTYALTIRCASPSVNPYIGSRLKCRLLLTRDGQPTKTIPKDSQGEPLFKEIGLYLATEGWQPAVTRLSYWDAVGLQPKLLVSQKDTFKAERTVVSPAGNPLGRGSLDVITLAKGEIDFEYIHNGFPGSDHAPYIEIVAASFSEPQPLSKTPTGNKASMMTNAIICFTDIVAKRVPIPRPYWHSPGGDFYYDVKFQPATVPSGKDTVIQLTVTARHSKTGRVNTDPFQRVAISVMPPMSSHNTATDYGHFLGPTIDLSNVYTIDQGNVSLNNVANPQIIKDSIYYATNIRDSYPHTAMIDLVNGKGVAYYAFTGNYQLLISGKNGPYLYFVVHPTNYNYIKSPDSEQYRSYRTQAKLKLPELPSSIGSTIEFAYLYQTWSAGGCLSIYAKGWSPGCVNPYEDIFTAAAVPMREFDPFSAPTTNWPWHLIWLITLQAVQIAAGSILIMALRRRLARRSYPPIKK